MSTLSKPIFSRLRPIFIVAFIAIGIFLAIVVLVSRNSPCAAPPPVTTHSASINALWEKEGFYITNKERRPPQIVALNKVVVLATHCTKVVALDGSTGNEIWKYNGSYIDGLAISSAEVFVADGSYVVALDVKTGKSLWSTRMPGGKGANTLHIQGDILYAAESDLLYELIDVRTGKALDWGRFGDGKFPPSEVFPARELQAANSLFGINTVIGNTGYWGSIRGVSVANIPNGNILWRYEIPLISPIAVTWDSIYAISENGELVRFDSATGSAFVKIHFTPAPLAHFIQNDGADYNNFVAVDPATNTAYVYLGDSQTLMAYQLHP